MKYGSAQVLLQAVQLRRARDRNDVGSLGQEPGQGDLGRRRAAGLTDLLQKIDEGQVLGPGLGLEPRDRRAEVGLFQLGFRADRTRQEALAERALRHEPDAELVAGCEDPIRLRCAPPQGVFVLNG